MNRDQALIALHELKIAIRFPLAFIGGEDLDAWRSKVRTVMVTTLGADDDLISALDKIDFQAGASGRPRGGGNAGFRTAYGLIEAAIYKIELLAEDCAPAMAQVSDESYDPELWTHVSGLVEDGDWEKVASQTAIFVENHIRQWAGDLADDKNGESLYGKTLFAKALADNGPLRLGARAGEREGWRYLGMGFSQAIGNAHRHRIQKRDDARRYAIGVLGLASLLLTQIRYEHADSIVGE